MDLDREPTKESVFRRQHCAGGHAPGAHHGHGVLRVFIGPTNTAWMQQHQRWWVRAAERVEAREGTAKKIRRRLSREPRADAAGSPVAGDSLQSLPGHYSSFESSDLESDWSSLLSAGEASSGDEQAPPGVSPMDSRLLQVPGPGGERNAIPMPALPPSPRPDSPQAGLLQVPGAEGKAGTQEAPVASRRSSLSTLKRLFRRHSMTRTGAHDASDAPGPGARRSLDAVPRTPAAGNAAREAGPDHGQAGVVPRISVSPQWPDAGGGQPRGPADAGAVSPKLSSLRRIAVTRSSMSGTRQSYAEASLARGITSELTTPVPQLSQTEIQIQMLKAAGRLGTPVSPAPSRALRTRRAIVAKVRAHYRTHEQLAESAVILSTRAVIRRETLSNDALSENYNETTCRRFRVGTQEWAEMWVALTKRGILFYLTSKRRPAVAVLFPPYAAVAPRVSLFSTLDLSLAIMYYSHAASAGAIAVEEKKGRRHSGAAAAAAEEQEAGKARLRAVIVKFPSAQVACEWYREIGQALLLGRVLYPDRFLHDIPPATQPPPTSVLVNVPEIGIKVQVNLGRHNMEIPTGVLQGGPDDALLERQWRCEATTVWHVRRDAVAALLRDAVVGPRVREWLEAERRGLLTIGMAWRRYDRLDWVVPCGALDAGGSFMVSGINDRVVCPQLLEGTHMLEMRVLEHRPDSVVVGGRRVDEPLGVEGFVMLKHDKRHRVEVAKYRPALLTTHDGFLFFIHAPRAVRNLEVCAGGCRSTPASAGVVPESGAWPAAPGRRSLGDISGGADGEEPVARHYHASGHSCAKQMSLAKHMLCIVDIEQIALLAHDPADPAHGDNGDGDAEAALAPPSPHRARAKGGSLRGLLRSKKEQQLACKFKLVTRTGATAVLWTASEQCAREWVQRLADVRLYWTGRIMADLALHSRACMLNYPIQGRGNRHRDMVDWSDEDALADRAIWNACLVMGCRNIIKAGFLYRKRYRTQGMRKVFCILTRGRLVEFAYPPNPLPPGQTAVAEHIVSHNPAMARVFLAAGSAMGTTRHADSAEECLLFSRSRSLSLRQCYVVSRFSDDLSAHDIVCEPWVMTDIGNYSGLRLADRVYADGIVSHELITDCIFTVWRPTFVPAILREPGGAAAIEYAPGDTSDTSEPSPGERASYSGSESRRSSPTPSARRATRERSVSFDPPPARQPAAGATPSPPQRPAALGAAAAAGPRASAGLHQRSASHDAAGSRASGAARHAAGDPSMSPASHASSAPLGSPDARAPGGQARLGIGDQRLRVDSGAMAPGMRRRVGVYRARTNAEMTQWVTAINQEIRRMSLAGECYLLCPDAERGAAWPADTELALLILNEAIPHRGTPLFERLWARADYRICADGGGNRLYALCEEEGALGKFVPDAVVGDLDSLLETPREYFEEQGAEIHRNSDQDATDFMKGLAFLDSALRPGKDPQSCVVVVIGGLGGRLDHIMHTLKVLFNVHQQRRMVVVSDENLAFVLPSGKNTILVNPQVDGPTCGILPLAGETVLTTAGLRWNLDAHRSSFEGLMSTSNIIEAREVTIETTVPVAWTAQFRPRALPRADSGE
ncbi:thiamine pyrophosphokinase [Coemansia javaensis]|uniref:Thiamine pyrophosphokinase n=1 Tax=Coemansia javaensis TaxID=2761396 RepID=A0A9W8LMT3_9FUNG|nr:thiamine pyrophosphokinase [Coemansia javaensis]